MNPPHSPCTGFPAAANRASPARNPSAAASRPACSSGYPPGSQQASQSAPGPSSASGEKGTSSAPAARQSRATCG